MKQNFFGFVTVILLTSLLQSILFYKFNTFEIHFIKIHSIYFTGYDGFNSFGQIKIKQFTQHSIWVLTKKTLYYAAFSLSNS